MTLEHPQGDPPQQAKVLGTVPVPDAAVVLSERHVQLPVQVVLDPPVAAQRPPVVPRVCPPAADEVAVLVARLAVHRPLAVAVADHAQLRPLLLVAYPFG